ncbi:MAG: hypothetical protein AAGA44_13490 [Pseudomonadota bacterium]
MAREVLLNSRDLIDKYRREADVSVLRSGEAHVVALVRDSVSVDVIVPDNVLEWFVRVHQTGKLVAQDWCDYCGYDQTPIAESSRDMANDVDQFLKLVVESELRIKQREKTWILGRTKPVLQALYGGSWRQVVPFAGSAGSGR